MIWELGMFLLIGSDTFEKIFHPAVAKCILGAYTDAVELADFWAEYFDCGIIPVHVQRVLNKVVDVLCNGIFLICFRVDEKVWLIANRPKFDRSDGTFIWLRAQVALGVIH